jgi:hypothetical protein
MRVVRVILAAWLGLVFVMAGGSGGGVQASPASPDLKPEDPVIRIDSATTARLCADCASRDVRFAVTVLSGVTLAAAKDTPQIVEVSVGGTRDAAVEKLFHGEWKAEDGGDGTPRALVLKIDAGLRTQGTYTVQVNGFPNQRPAAPKITLQIIVPAAKLQAPSKITIERIVGFGTVDAEPPSFPIRETGRIASIEKLAFDPPQLHAGTEPVTGQVSFAIAPSVKIDVPADRPATATIALAGDFPLGVSSGDLRLSAPELVDAITIPVEITSRLSKYHLFVAIVFGIIMSWWLKVFTHNLIERNTARAAAVRLLKRVRDDMLKFPDDPFQQTIAPAFQALETARQGSDVKVIDDARTALETKYREALQDLDRRRIDLAQRFAAFNELINLKWSLPATIQALLDTAKHALANAIALHKNGNIAKASTDFDDARGTLVTDLREQGAKWQRELRAVDDAILAQLQPTFTRVHAVLSPAQEAWRTQSALIDDKPQRPDPANIEPLLQRVDGEYRHDVDTDKTLLERLEQEEKTVINPASQPDQWKPVRDELDKLKLLLANAIETPADAANAVTASLQQLHDLFKQAEQQQTRSRSTTRGIQDTLLGGSGPSASAAAGALEPFPLFFGGAPRASGTSILFAGASIDPFDAEILAAETTVWRAKLQQSLIVGALFIVWSLATYSPTFDGTWIGLSTVFFSVFSADVAVDAMLTKMKR